MYFDMASSRKPGATTTRSTGSAPGCIEVRVLQYLTKRVPNRDPRIGVGLDFNEDFPLAVFNGNVNEILLKHDSRVPVFALE